MVLDIKLRVTCSQLHLCQGIVKFRDITTRFVDVLISNIYISPLFFVALLQLSIYVPLIYTASPSLICQNAELSSTHTIYLIFRKSPLFSPQLQRSYYIWNMQMSWVFFIGMGGIRFYENDVISCYLLVGNSRQTM